MNKLKQILSSFYKNYTDFTNIFLLIILTISVFYNSLGSYYLEVDDFSLLLHTQRNIAEVFVTNSYGGSLGGNYRPIEVLSHQFDINVYGVDSIFGRHFTNITFHIFNVVLVYLIGFQLTKKKTVGLIAGLLFSVHFIHSNSLPPTAWITGRIDLIITFFYLLSILLFIWFLSKGSITVYFISLITFILALMSKEMAATLPLIILSYLLLFPNNKGNDVLNLKRLQLVLKILLSIGILLIIGGFILNPSFLGKYFSSDRELEQITITKIQYLQYIVLFSGGLLISVVSLILLVLKFSKSGVNFFASIRYSIPYFIILAFYLMFRFLLLGGLGGGYISESGKAVNLDIWVDSFARDIFGLVGLIWPIGINYNIDIFKLQINNPFIFYALTFLISISIIIVLYKFVSHKQTVLIFIFLWICITIMPVNNLLISPWQYNTKYLYLPLVGFCILISFFIFKLFHNKNAPSSLVKVLVAIFISFIIVLSSFLLIKHNENLTESGEIMKSFVSDIKSNYQSKISDTTNIFFITYPISPITTASAVFIYQYMQDVLNYCDNVKDYGKKFKYYFLLFAEGEEKAKIDINWTDRRNFTIDGINFDNYFLIPDTLSIIDQEIRKIYKRIPPHAMLQPLPLIGATKETNKSAIKVLKFDKETNTFKLRVQIKESLLDALRNDLFFIYENGHFQLVKEF